MLKASLALIGALALSTQVFAASSQYVAPATDAAATTTTQALNLPTETLPSGVRIEYQLRAKGPKPTATSSVKVHYRGTLVSNGTEFDSSYKRGQPATFGLNQVIPCWTEGMQRLSVGSKAILTCPASTAYGARGAGAAVPANADLRFEVELLEIR